MTERFSDLKKVPKQPALRLLALANLKLDTRLDAPASASVEDVLRELAEKDAPLDILRMVSAALPAREAAWWACLAAEDYCRTTERPETASLKAARDWVLKPSDENRERARTVLETAEPGDDTAICAQAVAMCDGKLGPGEMSEYDAPPGAVAISAFGMNLMTLQQSDPEEFFAQLDIVIERGLDIARGGNGRLDGTAATTEGSA